MEHRLRFDLRNLLVLFGIAGALALVARNANAGNVLNLTEQEYAGILNSDGTLNLDSGFAGVVDSSESSMFPLNFGISGNSWDNNVNTETVDDLIIDVAQYLTHAEAFRGFVYDDATGLPWTESQKGNPTYGYGHKLASGLTNLTISQADAYQLLIKDVSEHLMPLISAVNVNLTLNQWVVLTSLAFNAGVTAVLNSHFLKSVNAGDDASAEIQFKDWNKATVVVNGQKIRQVVAGLVNRRAKEWDMWEEPQDVVMLEDSNPTA